MTWLPCYFDSFLRYLSACNIDAHGKIESEKKGDGATKLG